LVLTGRVGFTTLCRRAYSAYGRIRVLNLRRDMLKKGEPNKPAFDSRDLATPRDYSHGMYKVYFEVAEWEDNAYKVITEYLGPERSERVVKLDYGYEVELAIQCVPTLVQLLNDSGVGVYQVVRYAKVKESWG